MRTTIAPLMLLAALGTMAPGAVRAQDAATATTELHLSQQVRRQVAPDLIHVDLALEETGTDAERLQADLNRKLAAALDKAKSTPDVTVTTNGYTVFPEGDGKGPTRWHGVAGLKLTSGKFPAALALAGTLQQSGLLLSGIEFSVADATLVSLANDLAGEALAQLRARADRVASDLGDTVLRYQSVTVGNPFVPVWNRQVLAAPRAATGPVPPPAAPGAATVSLDVNAVIIVAPRKT